MKPKTTTTRYYLNTKTKQVAMLQGSRPAVKAHERYWKKQHVMIRRIPARVFNTDRPKVLFGFSTKYYPQRQRLGMRVQDDANGGLPMMLSFYYPAGCARPIVNTW